MYKVTVTVPATSTTLGPGLGVLGLALSLHTTIEMQVRADDRLHISVLGESREMFPPNLDNPVLRAAMRVFQHFEVAPAGLQIDVLNQIPWQAGLGAHPAAILGGILAANNLINGNLTHEQILEMTHRFGAGYENITSAMRGGLSICNRLDDQHTLHRSVDTVPLRVVVVQPTIPNYPARLENLPGYSLIPDEILHIGQTALVIEALREGDFRLLRQVMRNHAHQVARASHIPSYQAVVDAAQNAGAAAVVLSGTGPALLAIAESHHTQIAQTMVEAFQEAEIEARHWIVGVDRQGVTISVVE